MVIGLGQGFYNVYTTSLYISSFFSVSDWHGMAAETDFTALAIFMMSWMNVANAVAHFYATLQNVVLLFFPLDKFHTLLEIQFRFYWRPKD